jgi:hypothetical protein
MSRASRITCLLVAALLLPAHAEAAKMRFGGNKSSPNVSQARPAQARASRGTVIVAPGLGMSRAKAVEPGAPARVPFPPATAQALQTTPVALHASDDAGRKPWCRSEVVVGGFCVLN